MCQVPIQSVAVEYVRGHFKLSFSTPVNFTSYLVQGITSHVLKIGFYKLFYTYFNCLYLCGEKSLVQKPEPCFIFGWFSLGWYSVLQY